MKAGQYVLIAALGLVVGGLLFTGGIPGAFAAGEGAEMMGDWAAAQPATPGTPMTARFTTLLKAIKYTGLDEQLKGQGPFTVMAPTDAAFGALGQDMITALINNKAELTRVLKYHVIVGKALKIQELVKMRTAQTAEGGTLTFGVAGMAASGQGMQWTPSTINHPTVNGVAITRWNIPFKNGIIQEIAAVLSPM